MVWLQERKTGSLHRGRDGRAVSKCIGKQMKNHINPHKSVVARQLSKVGSDNTLNIFKAASDAMDDRELIALEAELKLFEDTGLVGVLMSRLIGLLPLEIAPEAA